jgi:aminoglycoside phosphotransferase
MSIKGSSYAHFRRALAAGHLHLVRQAAAELPRVPLEDALGVVMLIARREPERLERAAVRWLARLALERPQVSAWDLRWGLLAFEALPRDPEGARDALAELCDRHGLPGAAGGLRGDGGGWDTQKR